MTSVKAWRVWEGVARIDLWCGGREEEEMSVGNDVVSLALVNAQMVSLPKKENS